MTATHDSKYRHLTFSQREGKTPVISLKLEDLPQKFRIRLWHLMDKHMGRYRAEYWDILRNGIDLPYDAQPLQDFMDLYCMDVLGFPHDSDRVPNVYDFTSVVHFWKGTILKENYDIVLTLLEYFLQYDNSQWNYLKLSIKEMINEYTLYFVDDTKKPVCIMPVVSEESKEALEYSMGVLHDNEKAAAVNHLHSAAKNIAESQWQDAVRNSIHAVESVARTIAPKAKTLSEALNELSQNKLIEHKALAAAFIKLYGYTSDKEGIRHAEVVTDDAPVERDEAIFMYGACASFAAYLTMKEKRLRQD